MKIQFDTNKNKQTHDQFDQFQGFLKQAGQQIFNEALNAAGEYVGNAIQEMMVVKKEAEHPRVLPSLEHMKIVSE